MPTAKDNVQPRFKRPISAPGFYRELSDGTLIGSALFTEDITAPAAAGTTDVHASFLGDDVSNDFPGPFTQPDFPRTLRVAFAAGWDAGDVTIVGTDQFDAALTEVIADAAGTTVEGTKIFKTVASATKQSVGAAAAGASIGWGDTLGLSAELVANVGAVAADGLDEAGVWDSSISSVTPTTVPDGAVVYSVMYAAAL